MSYILVLLSSVILSEASETPDYRAEARKASEAIRSASVVYEVVREEPPTTLQDMPVLSADDIMLINLRRKQSERCTIGFDATRPCVKIQTEDLRNVPAILQANNVPPEQLVNVSRSTSLLVWEDGFARWTPNAKHLTVDQRQLRPQIADQPVFESQLETGCIPDPYFEAPLVDTRESRLDGAKVVRLTFEGQGVRLIVYLDPLIGYRYRRWERRGADNQLGEEKIARDYRMVNGVPFPFMHETNKYNAEGRFYHERISVHTAKLNLPLKDIDFSLEVPARSSVCDQRGGAIRRTSKAHVFTADSFPEVFAELDNDLRELNLEEARREREERIRQGLPVGPPLETMPAAD